MRPASRKARSSMKMIATSLSRLPTNHDRINLVSAIDYGPCPCSAGIRRGLLGGRDVLLLLLDERPNLVDLDALARQIAKDAIVIPSTDVASINHKLANSLFTRAGQSSPENAPFGANIVQGIDILWINFHCFLALSGVKPI